MSEFESKPIEESEKEAQGIKIANEIAQLRNQAQTDNDYKVILEKISELRKLFGIDTIETKSTGEIVTIDEAEKIMGKEFLGPEAIEKTFGIKLELSEIPAIQFSPEELKRAKELGQFLILRTDRIPSDKLKLSNTQKTLEKAPKTRWALVSKEIVSNSTGKNYLEQTEVLIDYLKNEVFITKDMPKEYQDAIIEFESQKEELRPLVKSTDEKIWKPAAERLSNLKITQFVRRTKDEVLYDLEVYYQMNKEYLLSGKWEWTSGRSSDGWFVDVGDFDSDGVGVSSYGPAHSDGLLGASSSRS